LGLPSCINIQGQGKRKKVEHDNFTEISDHSSAEIGRVILVKDGTVHRDVENSPPQIVRAPEFIAV